MLSSSLSSLVLNFLTDLDPLELTEPPLEVEESELELEELELELVECEEELRELDAELEAEDEDLLELELLEPLVFPSSCLERFSLPWDF